MRGRRNSTTGRIVAGMMGILLLAVMLCSVFYIAAEAGHNCEDGECPICAEIRQCENTVRRGGNLLFAQTAVIIPLILAAASVSLVYVILSSETPVSRKIRMNN